MSAPSAPVVASPSGFRLAFTLALAGLMSGLIIVGIYTITLPRIRANQAEALRRAVSTVLPGTERIQPLAYQESKWTPVESETGTASLYAGYDAGGALIGYAIPGEGPGYQDVIKILIGYSPSRERVVGMEVLESRETPGLGDKIFKDLDFVSAFHDLSPEPEILLVKGGGTGGINEVDAITGATISSKAVVKIVNEAYATWKSRLPGGDPAEGTTSAGAAETGEVQ